MILIIGWASNSAFSLMGVIRFIAQSISYEVRSILIIFSIIILRENYSLVDLVDLVWQLLLFLILRNVFALYLPLRFSSHGTTLGGNNKSYVDSCVYFLLEA